MHLGKQVWTPEKLLGAQKITKTNTSNINTNHRLGWVRYVGVSSLPKQPLPKWIMIMGNSYKFVFQTHLYNLHICLQNVRKAISGSRWFYSWAFLGIFCPKKSMKFDQIRCSFDPVCWRKDIISQQSIIFLHCCTHM